MPTLFRQLAYTRKQRRKPGRIWQLRPAARDRSTPVPKASRSLARNRSRPKPLDPSRSICNAPSMGWEYRGGVDCVDTLDGYFTGASMPHLDRAYSRIAASTLLMFLLASVLDRSCSFLGGLWFKNRYPSEHLVSQDNNCVSMGRGNCDYIHLS